MKKIFLIFICCLAAARLQAQTIDLEKTAAAIQAEGEALYQSEWASWYGSDIFLEKCRNKVGKQGGYLSYDNGKGLVNIFFSKDDEPVVLAATTFDYGFNPQKYSLDTTARALTKSEKELYIIRNAVVNAVKTDTLYKHYKNTSLNPVPLVYKGVKKVYVLTGHSANGVVLFGNDYLVTFNKNNQIASTTKLHNSLIVNQISRDSSKVVLASMHTHLKNKDEFITPTDICTAMLYGKFTTWNQCIVMSEKYTSVWDIKKNKLLILTKEAWNKVHTSDGVLKATKD